MTLDPDWPPQRLQQLCDEAQPAAVLWAAAACPGGHGQPCITGWPLVQLSGLGKLLQEEGAAADGDQDAAQQQPQQGPQPTPPSDVCYLLYTSGSTGRPLGVLGTQAGVLNRCRWMERVQPFQVWMGGWGSVGWSGLVCCTEPSAPGLSKFATRRLTMAPDLVAPYPAIPATSCCAACPHRPATVWRSRPPLPLWTASGRCVLQGVHRCALYARPCALHHQITQLPRFTCTGVWAAAGRRAAGGGAAGSGAGPRAGEKRLWACCVGDAEC